MILYRLFFYLTGIFYVYPPKDGKGERKESSKVGTTPTKTSTTTSSVTAVTSSVDTSLGAVSRPSALSTTQAPVVTTTSSLVTPGENDPRVGWVYRLSKAEIEDELRKVGLPIEGLANDLRKRFVTYLRSQQTPTENIETQSLEYAGLPPATMTHPISSVNPSVTQIFSDPWMTSQPANSQEHNRGSVSQELAELREMLGLSPAASVEQVKRSLSELMMQANRTGSKESGMAFSLPPVREPTSYHRPISSFLGFATKQSTPHLSGTFIPASVPSMATETRFAETPANPAIQDNSASNLAHTCNTVRKWNLRYDGDKDAVSFLERLSELVEAYDIDKQCLLKALPEVFKGQALLWYRNNKDSWNTYEDFLDSFQQHFLPRGYRRMLGDEIKRRTQGETERFRSFVTAITTLMRRCGGFSTNDQLNQIYTNMRPDYKLTIWRESFSSITEFIQLAESYEHYLQERGNYRPPPNPSQVLIPETAFDPKANYSKLAGIEPYEPSYAFRDTKPKPFSRNNVTARNSNFQSGTYSDQRQFRNNTAPIQRNPHEGTNFKQIFTANENQTVSPKVTLSDEIVRCWNCEESGHKFNQCNKPKVIKCFNCKKPGVRTVHCGCQSGNEQRGQGTGGTLSLGKAFRNSPPLMKNTRGAN